MYAHADTYIHMYSIIISIHQYVCSKLQLLNFLFLCVHWSQHLAELFWSLNLKFYFYFLSFYSCLPHNFIFWFKCMQRKKKKKIDHTVSGPKHRCPPSADTGQHPSAVTSCSHPTILCTNSEVKLKFKDRIVYTLGNL